MSHDAIRDLIECELATKVEVRLCDLMALIEDRDRVRGDLDKINSRAASFVGGLGKVLQRLADVEAEWDLDGSISGGADPLTDAEQEAFDNMALPLEDLDIRCSFGKQCHLRSVAEREESGDQTQTKPSPCDDPPAGPDKFERLLQQADAEGVDLGDIRDFRDTDEFVTVNTPPGVGK